MTAPNQPAPTCPKCGSHDCPSFGPDWSIRGPHCYERQIAKLEAELAGIQSWCEQHHNGYSEESRQAMAPNLKKPESIIQCLNELLTEESEMRQVEAQIIESQLTAAITAKEGAERERDGLVAGHLETVRERIKKDMAQDATAFSDKTTGELCDILTTAMVAISTAFHPLLSATASRLTAAQAESQSLRERLAEVEEEVTKKQHGYYSGVAYGNLQRAIRRILKPQ